MPTYKYRFCDGAICEVEVSDQHLALLKKMDEQEKENNRRHTRHSSPPPNKKAANKDGG